MSQLVIRRPGGAVERVPVGGRAIVGSAVDADVRVAALAPHQLVVQRAASGFLAIAAKGTTGFMVNGERRARHKLADGDVLEVGEVRIVFEAAAESATAADLSSAADSIASDLGLRAPVRSRHRASAPRPRRGRSGLWVSTMVAIAIGGAAVWYQVAQGRTTVDGLLDSAERFVAGGEVSRAESVLAAAEAMAPVGAARQRLTALVERVEVERRRRSGEVALAAARNELQTLRNFERAYAAREGAAAREPARELVRMIDRWLARHAAVCERVAGGEAELTEVRALRARHATVARLGEPDRVDDVLFRARHAVRLKRRRYAAALAELDGYTAATEAERQPVRALRAQLLVEAEAWLEDQVGRIKALLERGERSLAADELAHLEEHGLADWGPRLQPLRAALDAR